MFGLVGIEVMRVEGMGRGLRRPLRGADLKGFADLEGDGARIARILRA